MPLFIFSLFVCLWVTLLDRGGGRDAGVSRLGLYSMLLCRQGPRDPSRHEHSLCPSKGAYFHKGQGRREWFGRGNHAFCRMQAIDHTLTMVSLLPEAGITPENGKRNKNALRMVKPMVTDSLRGAAPPPLTDEGRPAHRVLGSRPR